MGSGAGNNTLRICLVDSVRERASDRAMRVNESKLINVLSAFPVSGEDSC